MSKKHRKKSGFTLIELLVVIAIIALLLSIIMPALSRVKVIAQKTICRSNMRQQSLGVMLYANENDTWVPTVNSGSWLWDLSFWSTNQISSFAGFDDNKIYYCPSNKLKEHDDARFWQFQWVFSWGVDLTQKQAIRDESVLTIAQQRDVYYRVMPTLYMFDKINSAGNSTLPATLVSGTRSTWVSKLSNLRSASSTLLLMDNVISQGTQNFFEITAGGVGTTFNTFDNSNHASRQRFTGTNYVKPEGANLVFADGSVGWRNFDDMQVQVNNGGVNFWW